MTKKLKELIRTRIEAFDKYDALNYALVACALDSAAVSTLLTHLDEATDADEICDYEMAILTLLEDKGTPSPIAENLFFQFDEARKMYHAADKALEADEEYRAFGDWDSARRALEVEGLIELTDTAKNLRGRSEIYEGV